MFTSENRIIVFSHVAAINLSAKTASVFLDGGKVLELSEREAGRFLDEFTAWASFCIPQVEAVK